jgi:aspartyl-tRNA(Asn)/glutamyl-tRNA(Gln) amidotransferase subunit C
MSLNRTEIEAIAHLARLGLEPAEIESFGKSLSDILGLVEQIRSVDTDAVEPLAHPLDVPARLRADEVTEANQRNRFQQTAPAVERGCYLVPRVVD